MQKSSPAERVQTNLQELFKAELAPGDPYIKFQLTSESTALMSMAQVEESRIITVDRITPLPGMPKSVIGTIDSRNRVFCIYDLAQLLNLSSPLVNLRKYQIVVLDISKILDLEKIMYVGFAVRELQGIIRFTRDRIESSFDVPMEIDCDYISGYIQKKPQRLLILNFKHILESLIGEPKNKQLL